MVYIQTGDWESLSSNRHPFQTAGMWNCPTRNPWCQSHILIPSHKVRTLLAPTYITVSLTSPYEAIYVIPFHPIACVSPQHRSTSAGPALPGRLHWDLGPPRAPAPAPGRLTWSRAARPAARPTPPEELSDVEAPPEIESLGASVVRSFVSLPFWFGRRDGFVMQCVCV